MCGRPTDRGSQSEDKANDYDHFTIGSLMENLPPLETIDSKVPIRDALAKMCIKEYSQLPVLKNNKCIGAVTLDSIARRLVNLDKKGKLGREFMDLPVEGFVDKNTRYASADDDLLKHVEWMADKGFVIIGAPYQKPKAIVTNYDLVLFLKYKTEPFLLLREIETTLRYVVRQKLQNEKLREALASIETADGSKPSRIDELTLDNLRQLICTRKNWMRLKDAFVDRDLTNKRLETICKLRNQILHFRGRLLHSELVQLRNLRDQYFKLAKTLES